MRILTLTAAFLAAVCLTACTSSVNRSAQTETTASTETAAVTTAPQTGTFACATAAVTEQAVDAPVTQPSEQPSEPEETEPEPEYVIELTPLDDEENYSFEFDGMTFYACYTPDNWHITDSYRVRQTEDMKVICQALIDLHPIHGSDMESWRTPEDMAEEWIYHDLAYELLSDGDPWKERAKDVDLDPYDQGKSLYELFLSKREG